MLNRLKESLCGDATELLNRIPDSVWQSNTTTFLDPDVGNGQFLSEIVSRLRAAGHDDESIKSRVFGIYELEVDLNYARNKSKDLLIGTFGVGDFLVSDLRKKFDVIVCSPDVKTDGGASNGNNKKHWMLVFQKICDSLKIGGYALMFLPPTWSSPSKECGIKEKILTTLTSKFNLIEARFGLESRVSNVGLSAVLFSKTVYEKTTTIGDSTYDLSGLIAIPFWLDKLGIHLKAQRQLLAVPESERYIFVDRSTHGMFQSMLSEKKKPGFVKFPNASGKNNALYGSPKGVDKAAWNKARVGIPKLLCSYVGDTAILTADPYGRMGCMHNVRMAEIERGAKANYNKSLFRYLQSLNRWNRNYVEVRVMSLLIKNRNIRKYLTEDVLKMIDSY